MLYLQIYYIIYKKEFYKKYYFWLKFKFKLDFYKNNNKSS